MQIPLLNPLVQQALSQQEALAMADTTPDASSLFCLAQRDPVLQTLAACACSEPNALEMNVAPSEFVALKRASIQEVLDNIELSSHFTTSPAALLELAKWRRRLWLARRITASVSSALGLSPGHLYWLCARPSIELALGSLSNQSTLANFLEHKNLSAPVSDNLLDAHAFNTCAYFGDDPTSLWRPLDDSVDSSLRALGLAPSTFISALHDPQSRAHA